MCTIDKMLIKGIRSFSPENDIVIEFCRPLTLIVGQNGAGKTTIIECLKMACTGELPPNTRSGQTFIHDPKVSGTTEVKAQIKLRFRTAKGDPIVTIRSFQLTQRAKKLEYKTLDSTIYTRDPVTKVTTAMTKRCSDMDRMVPVLMGVSKAILDNVIFVHQEESNWPLSEGATLKKKFDDIFAATKYTKALEHLNKLRKDRKDKIKEQKLMLATITAHKTQSDTLTLDLRRYSDDKRRLDTDCESLKTRLVLLQDKCRSGEQDLAKLQHVVSEQRRLMDQVKLLRQQVTDAVSRNGPDFFNVPDSDDDLRAFLVENQTALELDIKSRKEALDAQIRNARSSLARVKDEYANTCQVHGRLMAGRDAYEADKKERERMASVMAHQMHFGVTAWEQVLAGVEKRIADAIRLLDETRDANRAKGEALNKVVDEARSHVKRAEDTVQMMNEQIDKVNVRLAMARSLVQPDLASTLDDSNAKENEREAQRHLEQCRSAVDNNKLNMEMRQVVDRVTAAQNQLAALRKEKDGMMERMEQSTSIRLKQEEITKKEAQLGSMVSSLQQAMHRLAPSPMLTLLLNQMPAQNVEAHAAAPTLVSLITSHHASMQQLVLKSQEQLHAAKSARAAQEAELKTVREQLVQLEQDHSVLQRNMERTLLGTPSSHTPSSTALMNDLARNPSSIPLQAMCDQTNSELSSTREDYYEQKSSLSLFSHAKDKADSGKRACSLCSRPFAHEAELQSFKESMQRKCDKMHPLLREMEIKLREQEEKLRQYELVRPLWMRLSEVERSIQQSKERIRGLDEALRQTGQVLVQKSNDVADADRMARDVSLLMQDARAMETLLNDLNEKKCHAGVVEAYGYGGMYQPTNAARTLPDLDRALLHAEEELRAATVARDSKQQEHNRKREELVAATMAYGAAKEKLNASMNRAKERQVAQSQLQEAERDRASYEAEIKMARDRMPLLRTALSNAERDKQAHADKASTEQAALEARVLDEQRGGDHLTQINQRIVSYERGIQARDLQDCETKLVEQRHRQETLEAEMQARQEELAALELDSRDLEAKVATTHTIMIYRENLSTISKHERRLAELKDQGGGDVDQEAAIQRALKKHKEEEQGVRDELNHKQGEVGVIRVQLDEVSKRLGNKEYRDILDRHLAAEVDVKVNELAALDLDHYAKALERALLSFHTEKMAAINKIIKELWQKTYRNQDIDYIQIKADMDEEAAAGGATTGKSQKSYNYRVVMYSGGAELEMRGRCSAGQKVLACLIIRLALAETFCLNCGILALDEPTTNLDAENAASLAEALRTVIISRAEQRNFQLIVITHDEDFAHRIGTREYAEYYWKVTKEDGQHSKIEKQATYD